jgi:hypothetical protein
MGISVHASSELPAEIYFVWLLFLNVPPFCVWMVQPIDGVGYLLPLGVAAYIQR